MGAPEGNQFWKLRSKHGRNKLFETPELMWEAACEYFTWCEENPFYETVLGKGSGKVIMDDNGEFHVAPDTVELPKMRPFTLYGLCIYLDCSTGYFREFKKDCSKDFVSVVTRIEEVIYNQKYSGAASGFLNPNIIARDLGLIDKQDIKQETTVIEVRPPKFD